MKVLVSGSSGLIGTAVRQAALAAGYTVCRLVRAGRPAEPSDVLWDPATGVLDEADLTGCDGVVHLAGHGIAARWTAETRARIRDSRVRGTAALCQSLARASPPPRVLLCASAVGYYGDRGVESLTEASAAGEGFLPTICREWEAACAPAAEAGLRVVNLRFGMVLSPAGGALAKMLPPFQLGLGGRVGSGRQYWSWVHLADAAEAVVFALGCEGLRGPVNVVSPNPVTNSQFTRALGRILHKPTLCPAPAFALRLAFGQMARELLLAGARVEPAKLEAAGFVFRYGELGPALRDLLGRPA